MQPSGAGSEGAVPKVRRVRHLQNILHATPPTLQPLTTASLNADDDDIQLHAESYHSGGGGFHAGATSVHAETFQDNFSSKSHPKQPTKSADVDTAPLFQPTLLPLQHDADQLTTQNNSNRGALNERIHEMSYSNMHARDDRLVYAQRQTFSPPAGAAASMVEQAGGPDFIFNQGITSPLGRGGSTGRRRNNTNNENLTFLPLSSTAQPTASSSSSFHHIADLDKFFQRAYRYHQHGGFWCMALQELLEIVQFIFVTGFSVFLLRCVNYPVLFRNKPPPTWWTNQQFYYSKLLPLPNSTTSPLNDNNSSSSAAITPIDPAMPNSNRTNLIDKLRLSDALIPASECLSHMPFTLILIFIVAALYLLVRLIRFCRHLSERSQMQQFYQHALHIKSDSTLQDYTWYEILHKILHAQRHHQMSVHKSELTELDVYQRILRTENYLIAMLNKGMLPAQISLFNGMLEMVYMPRLYELNLELLLFRSFGYAAPFENCCSLRDDYKQYGQRVLLAERMRRRIVYLALGNLLLSPLLFLWQCLYIMFNYGALLRRDPGVLGARMWSRYGKWYLRHFNELEHELQARLNRAYVPANQYMSIFISPLVTTLAHNLVFFAGSVLVVLVALTVWDEDVITVEHVITIITVMGVLVAIGRAMLPDENLIWNPQQLMTTILAQIHYMPDGWTVQAHKTAVRDQVTGLFQFKLVYLLQELWSPVLTPLMLLFCVRNRAAAIVDFLRNYTEDVVGVGDVCTFALMDVRRHGRREWMPTAAVSNDLTTESAAEREIYDDTSSSVDEAGKTPAAPRTTRSGDDILLESSTNDADTAKTSGGKAAAANFGKTELSLIHFKLLNPKWTPLGKHNQRYLELVLRKCLQVPAGGGGFDQAPPLLINNAAAAVMSASMVNPLLFTTSLYAAAAQQQRQPNNVSSNSAMVSSARSKGQLNRFEGAPAHELARYMTTSSSGAGGAASVSEHSNSTSTSGMSEASSSAAAAAAAAAMQQQRMANSTTDNMLRSMLVSGTGGIAATGGDGLTVQAMSTSVLQVHGAHLARRMQQQQQHRLQVSTAARSTSTAAAAAAGQYHNNTTAALVRTTGSSDDNDDDEEGDTFMTKAALSVIPPSGSVDDDGNEQQQHPTGFSTTANAGSMYGGGGGGSGVGAWASSVQRWFPMRLIAGESTSLRRQQATERAPLVHADSLQQQQRRRTIGNDDDDLNAAANVV